MQLVTGLFNKATTQCYRVDMLLCRYVNSRRTNISIGKKKGNDTHNEKQKRHTLFSKLKYIL